MTLCRRGDGLQQGTEDEEEEVQRWRGQREGERGGKGHRAGVGGGWGWSSINWFRISFAPGKI